MNTTIFLSGYYCFWYSDKMVVYQFMVYLKNKNPQQQKFFNRHGLMTGTHMGHFPYTLYKGKMDLLWYHIQS